MQSTRGDDPAHLLKQVPWVTVAAIWAAFALQASTLYLIAEHVRQVSLIVPPNLQVVPMLTYGWWTPPTALSFLLFYRPFVARYVLVGLLVLFVPVAAFFATLPFDSTFWIAHALPVVLLSIATFVAFRAKAHSE